MLSIPRRILTALTALALALLPAPSRATSAEPVTFEAMVKGAERIFVGEVVAIESFQVIGRTSPRLRMRVTFSVDESLRGPGVQVALEFGGGTLGDLSDEVSGMPRFVVGERYVVFARDGHQWISPVVGFSQGLFRVSRDVRDGTSRVLTASRSPLPNVAAIGRPSIRVSTTMTVPMALPDFLQAVRTEMAKNAR